MKRISTALGLLAATAVVARAQTPAPGSNQATAEAVAAALRSNPNLSPYRIEIETRDGMAVLAGSVATPEQKKEAMGLALRVAGVRAVVDRLVVGGDNRVRPVQYQVPAGPDRVAGGPRGDIIYDGGLRTGPAMGGPGMAGPGMYGPGMGGPGMGGPGMGGPGMYGPGMGGPGMGGPGMYEGGMGGPGGEISDGPMPEGPAGSPNASLAAMPRNPNYAWPSYAPYPNFSAVGYPTVYPWQAWPNIAPPYPYPEVPLDWRAVTLRWDDGIWWLDFKKNYTRPFFTPYPFGIFAY
jgi:hypothetical protein